MSLYHGLDEGTSYIWKKKMQKGKNGARPEFKMAEK